MIFLPSANSDKKAAFPVPSWGQRIEMISMQPCWANTEEVKRLADDLILANIRIAALEAELKAARETERERCLAIVESSFDSGLSAWELQAQLSKHIKEAK